MTKVGTRPSARVGMSVPFIIQSRNVSSRLGRLGTIGHVEVAERIGREGSQLTPAERRVAEVVLDRPQLVAFGTVAELAEVAGSGAATVVRLASKLGYDGFTGLQQAVQNGLARQLRPAAERIHEPAASDALGRHLELEVDNVVSTLRAVDPDALAEAVDRLATSARVVVVSGDASLGVARQLVGDLASLRPGVDLLEGNEVSVRRAVALLGPDDTVVALDLRRYDRWAVEAVRTARPAVGWCLAITDSLLSPLAALADRTFTVSAAGAGPFDSHVGTLALANVVVAGVADRLRSGAADRLARVEDAWRSSGALTDQ